MGSSNNSEYCCATENGNVEYVEVTYKRQDWKGKHRLESCISIPALMPPRLVTIFFPSAQVLPAPVGFIQSVE